MILRTKGEVKFLNLCFLYQVSILHILTCSWILFFYFFFFTHTLYDKGQMLGH